MQKPTFDLVIPAHNEEKVIILTLRLASDALARIPDLTWRIIVAENGSDDDTTGVVERARLLFVKVFSARSRGKGAAIREALEHSDAEYFGFMDADAPIEFSVIGPALNELSAHHANLVIGSRFHPDSIVERRMFRQTFSRIFNILARLIVGIKANDSQCPLKIMDQEGRRVLAACKENSWFLDIELIARAERAGLRISVVPVVLKEIPCQDRESTLALGRDGIQAIATMFRLRKRLAEEAVK